MPKGVAKGKKLVLVPSDLLARLMEVSSREGKTFYNFISEILEQALRVYESKHTLKEVVDFFELMETQRASGSVIMPMDMLTYLINELYSSKRKELHEKSYESGQWYGKYLLDRFHGQDQIKVLERLLATTRWDLNEVQVVNDDEKVRIRCVSPLLPIENTELLLKFIEGVMHSFGYKTVKEDFMKGIILLEFEKVQ